MVETQFYPWTPYFSQRLIIMEESYVPTMLERLHSAFASVKVHMWEARERLETDTTITKGQTKANLR